AGGLYAQALSDPDGLGCAPPCLDLCGYLAGEPFVGVVAEGAQGAGRGQDTGVAPARQPGRAPIPQGAEATVLGHHESRQVRRLRLFPNHEDLDLTGVVLPGYRAEG